MAELRDAVGGYFVDDVHKAFVQSWIDGTPDMPSATRTRLGLAHIESWRSPASAYPRARCGVARIKTAWYAPGVYDAYGQNGVGYYHAGRRLYITTLEIDGECWMVDDPPHWWAMQDHASRYEGHVLCAGLGLGLIVHALDANEAVEQITVVERERDVIELVGPLLPGGKLELVHGDFWDQERTGSLADVSGVFWDLFVGHGPTLVASAVEVMSTIRERWGGRVRIHGVPNDMIATLASVRESFGGR
jgi:hypothetical protein